MSEFVNRIETLLATGSRIPETDILEYISNPLLAASVVEETDGKYTIYTIYLPSGKSLTYRNSNL